MASLLERFPQLRGTKFRLEKTDGGPADDSGLPNIDLHVEEETPDATKDRIIDELRAQGVEGDIAVDIQGEDGEHKVEVKVRKGESAASRVVSSPRALEM